MSLQTESQKQSFPSRRKFLGRGSTVVAASALAFPFVSSRNVLGANSRLNIAAVGVGGKGAVDIGYCGALGENIVALCDVDQKRAAATFAKFPKAKRFVDFRKMFDQLSDEIDAVTVSTPDHSHIHPAVMAMKAGKHVYVQKPLTHTIEEARLLTRLAKETGVVTQMGNQGHSHPDSRRLVELIRHGVLGDVTEVHTWTNRPIWPQGLDRPNGSQQIPTTLNWDLWLGTAPQRPYNDGYVPFNWRGWWDFGTGSLGDMACHNMDMYFWALGLKDPISVEAKAKTYHPESPPRSCEITWTFAGKTPNAPIKVTWYDGGRKPDPKLAGRSKLETSNGTIVVGSKDTLHIPFFWGAGNFTSGASMKDYKNTVPQSIPRAPAKERDFDRAHHLEWINACKGKGNALSHFGYAAPMTEAILLGNVSLRARQKIEWNAREMRVTNSEAANALVKKQYRKGWELLT